MARDEEGSAAHSNASEERVANALDDMLKTFSRGETPREEVAIEARGPHFVGVHCQRLDGVCVFGLEHIHLLIRDGVKADEGAVDGGPEVVLAVDDGGDKDREARDVRTGREVEGGRGLGSEMEINDSDDIVIRSDEDGVFSWTQ